MITKYAVFEDVTLEGAFKQAQMYIDFCAPYGWTMDSADCGQLMASSPFDQHRHSVSVTLKKYDETVSSVTKKSVKERYECDE